MNVKAVRDLIYPALLFLILSAAVMGLLMVMPVPQQHLEFCLMNKEVVPITFKPLVKH